MQEDFILGLPRSLKYLKSIIKYAIFQVLEIMTQYFILNDIGNFKRRVG